MVLFAVMKFILLGVFVTFFVALPMYLLNSLVMPELSGLKQTYSQASNIAVQSASYQK